MPRLRKKSLALLARLRKKHYKEKRAKESQEERQQRNSKEAERRRLERLSKSPEELALERAVNAARARERRKKEKGKPETPEKRIIRLEKRRAAYQRKKEQILEEENYKRSVYLKAVVNYTLNSLPELPSTESALVPLKGDRMVVDKEEAPQFTWSSLAPTTPAPFQLPQESQIQRLGLTLFNQLNTLRGRDRHEVEYVLSVMADWPSLDGAVRLATFNRAYLLLMVLNHGWPYDFVTRFQPQSTLPAPAPHLPPPPINNGILLVPNNALAIQAPVGAPNINLTLGGSALTIGNHSAGLPLSLLMSGAPLLLNSSGSLSLSTTTAANAGGALTVTSHQAPPLAPPVPSSQWHNNGILDLSANMQQHRQADDSVSASDSDFDDEIPEEVLYPEVRIEEDITSESDAMEATLQSQRDDIDFKEENHLQEALYPEVKIEEGVAGDSGLFDVANKSNRDETDANESLQQDRPQSPKMTTSSDHIHHDTNGNSINENCGIKVSPQRNSSDLTESACENVDIKAVEINSGDKSEDNVSSGKREKVDYPLPQLPDFSVGKLGEYFGSILSSGGNGDSAENFKPGELDLQCKQCFKSFRLVQELVEHRVRLCDTVHVCSVCSTSFRQRHSLIGHMTIHSGIKPFECLTCGRAFRKKSDLKRHSQIHNPSQPEACGVCGKTCSTKSNLVIHMRLHSANSRRYRCQYCDQTFNQKYLLITHVRTHTGERPFICDVCTKRFIDKTSLRVHIRNVHKKRVTKTVAVETPPPTAESAQAE